jgi:predicted secreted hydrolase
MMGRRLALVLALIAATLAAWWWLPAGTPPGEPRPMAIATALGEDDGLAGYARALAPRPLRFPADHGPHEAYRTEWWYVTGNLAATGGRRLGYQITFFRIALRPRPVTTGSGWRTEQVYMAHLALTDAASARHRGLERFSRAALGLAGATAEPFRVWLEDWELASVAEGFFPLRIRARSQDFALELQLTTAKPMVLQGERGLSRKGAEPGNASYYYSFTRLPTQGQVRLDGERLAVTGTSWLDREWSTSALEADQVGWDWFALQLDDGRELMYYRLRARDGDTHPYSAGVLVDATGATRTLSAEAVQLRALGHWRSPHTGIRYPVAWQLDVPRAGLQLQVEPLVKGQEMRTTAHYWEGAVEVEGSASGVGYLEMTGYGDAGQ